MNEKFYTLPTEKQERIINAGFHVFSRNSYRKSPVQEIALKAGISKSLLFFYFRNKKELYLFLWRKAEEITAEVLKDNQIDLNSDFFDRMVQSLIAKTEILKTYPDILNFSIRVYYEDDPEVREDVRKTVMPYTALSTNTTLTSLDVSQFKEGLDLRKMYEFIYYALEGYVWQISRQGNTDVDRMISDYKNMTDFWKTLFLK